MLFAGPWDGCTVPTKKRKSLNTGRKKTRQGYTKLVYAIRNALGWSDCTYKNDKVLLIVQRERRLPQLSLSFDSQSHSSATFSSLGSPSTMPAVPAATSLNIPSTFS